MDKTMIAMSARNQSFSLIRPISAAMTANMTFSSLVCPEKYSQETRYSMVGLLLEWVCFALINGTGFGARRSMRLGSKIGVFGAFSEMLGGCANLPLHHLFHLMSDRTGNPFSITPNCSFLSRARHNQFIAYRRVYYSCPSCRSR